jgi:hypothetical protein
LRDGDKFVTRSLIWKGVFDRHEVHGVCCIVE